MHDPKPLSLSRALLVGTVGFTIASLMVYGFWAAAGAPVQRALGEAGFYAVCAVIFVLLGAVLLRPLARSSFARFSLIFAAAFFVYALFWCLGWFFIRGRMGEWFGGLAASFGFCMVLAISFRAWRALLLTTLVLFLGHSVGYFLGGAGYGIVKGYGLTKVLPQLAWGLFHGLGTGAGIGFAFYKAQTPPP